MTHDVRKKLIDCFALVFPDLGEQEIVNASRSSVAKWDSVATLTLFAVLEEQFAVQMQPEDLVDLISFDLVLDFLESRHGAT